jgi:hypothetical protein
MLQSVPVVNFWPSKALLLTTKAKCPIIGSSIVSELTHGYLMVCKLNKLNNTGMGVSTLFGLV